MKFLDELTQWLNKILLVIGGLALTAIAALTVGNIFSRNLWAPIKGMVELVGFCGAIAAAFALGFAQVKHAHIAVDVLVLKFSKRTQKLLSAVNAILGAVFFAIAGWQLVRWGNTLRQTGEVTETLRIIYHPVVYAFAFGCFVMALVLVAECLKTFTTAQGAK
jgi:TRAP-type C4-dicarboxylate transport system permease small subunit